MSRDPYSHAYYLRHKEEINRRNLIWYYNNPGYFKKSQLKTRYGITYNEFIKLRRRQNNRCAICQRKEKMRLRGKIKQLAVDHCHKSKTIRGLLCHSCNLGLGKFDDNKALIYKAFKYISKFTV